MVPARALELLRAGHRRTLAQALSRAESRLASDREWLDELWRINGSPCEVSLRLAVTGPPGAGKSTLIEAMGKMMLDAGRRVAVLPIDPSSRRSGGSLLADVTRMPRLSSDQRAYVRPSASRQMLGGVAQHTLDSVELCELAGYDTVFIETVGVGQSEADAELVADVVLLVVPPHSGDAIQALKRGINEACDTVVVNKADGSLVDAARRMAAEYQGTLSLFRAAEVPLFCVSAAEGTGLAQLTQWVENRRAALTKDAMSTQKRRQQQRGEFFERVVSQRLLEELFTRPGLSERYADLLLRVRSGALRTQSALAEIVDSLLRDA